MNIFYYSVHHILEYDELLMLRSLGHDVFRLGTRDRTTSTANWRPEVANTDREDCLHDIYESLGGRYHNGKTLDEILPPTFIDHFSAVIVMHSIDFIAAHWDKLGKRPVIWRTIGQDIDRLEHHARPFRDQGLKVVRYSPLELRAPISVGGDAVIRFCKQSDDYRGWLGNDKSLLSFANTYQQRYPAEADDFRSVAAVLPSVLGGYGNDSFPQSIGVLSSDDQRRRYETARLYLYASGLTIPYTLNFMEAWMTGTPVVVYAPTDRLGPYFEVDQLIQDGETGFICRTVDEVLERGRELIENEGLAKRISNEGRAAAVVRFGQDKIATQWEAVLDTCR